MEEVLRIEDLRTHFFTDEGMARAVDGVSLSVAKGRPSAWSGIGLRQIGHRPFHPPPRAGAARQDRRRRIISQAGRYARARRSRCATSGESSRR